MTNKVLLLLVMMGVAVIFVGSSVYFGASSNKTGMDGARVNVDGDSLRINNKEFIVTNFLLLSVKPTKKTSEWIYVHGVDCEILVN